MTEPEAQKLVTVLVTAFPSQLAKLSQKQQLETMAVYRRMLGDLDYPVANAAVEQLIAISRFLPTVAEIRGAALSLVEGERKPGGEAWGDVLAAVGRYGSYRTPVFEDPIVEKCVQAFGWANICSSENQPADRARFIELYDQLAEQNKRKRQSEALPATQRLRELQARQGKAIEAGEAFKGWLEEGEDAA